MSRDVPCLPRRLRGSEKMAVTRSRERRSYRGPVGSILRRPFMSNPSFSVRRNPFTFVRLVTVGAALAVVACSNTSGGTTGTGGTGGSGAVHDPATATVASVDRFSAQAGHSPSPKLQQRAPGGERGGQLRPGTVHHPRLRTYRPGREVLQLRRPAGHAGTDLRLLRGGSQLTGRRTAQRDRPIPGETGYNDFWQVMMVTVPSGYAPTPSPA